MNVRVRTVAGSSHEEKGNGAPTVGGAAARTRLADWPASPNSDRGSARAN